MCFGLLNNTLFNNTIIVFYDPTTHIHWQLIIHTTLIKKYIKCIHFILAMKKIEMDNLGLKIVNCTGPEIVSSNHVQWCLWS